MTRLTRAALAGMLVRGHGSVINVSSRLAFSDPLGPRSYRFDVSDSLQVILSTIAKDEGRPENELIPELLNAGLTQYVSNERIWKKWETLSPREKDVAALVCLGYTNREIGARQSISSETVKDRLETALKKLNFTKRTELRDLLSIWDFSEWERQP